MNRCAMICSGIAGQLANKSCPSLFLLTVMAFSRRHSTFLSSQSRKAVEL